MRKEVPVVSAPVAPPFIVTRVFLGHSARYHLVSNQTLSDGILKHLLRQATGFCESFPDLDKMEKNLAV